MARTGWSSSNFLRYAAGVVTSHPCTLSCWFNAATTPSVNQHIFGLFTSGSAINRNSLRLILLGAGTIQANASNGSTANGPAVGPITDNIWNHGAAVFHSNVSRHCYLNGSSSSENTVDITPSGIDRTSIGIGDASTQILGLSSSALVAEAAAWDIDLTPAEVAQLAAGYSPLFVRPANLVGYWPLMGRASPEFNYFDRTSVLSVQGTLSAAAHPRIIMPRARLLTFVQKIQTLTPGLSSEADSALSVSRAKSRAIGLSSEADSAFSVGYHRTVQVGLSSETDSAFSVGLAKSLAIGLSSETDSALSVGRIKTGAVGLATETDEALSVATSAAVNLGLSSETDSALSLTWEKVLGIGLSSETDSALSVGLAKSRAISLSSETDSALSVGRSKFLSIGLPPETDSAFSLTWNKVRAVGLSSEIDIAQTVRPGKSYSLGLSSEIDSAFSAVPLFGINVYLGLISEIDVALPVGRLKTRSVGLTIEVDTALLMAFQRQRQATVGGAHRVNTQTGIRRDGSQAAHVHRSNS